MLVEGIKRVCYDPNMWVSYMRGGRDMFFGACSPLFDRVERGRSFVVVPHLAMAETIHVLRKLTTDEFKPTFVEAEDHAGIRAECRSKRTLQTT